MVATLSRAILIAMVLVVLMSTSPNTTLPVPYLGARLGVVLVLVLIRVTLWFKLVMAVTLSRAILRVMVLVVMICFLLNSILLALYPGTRLGVVLVMITAPL